MGSHCILITSMDENLPPMQVNSPIPPVQPPVGPVVQPTIPPVPPVETPTDSKIMTKIALVFLILAFLSLLGFVAKDFLDSKKKEAACTMEAKVCPDGTSVQRSGSRCEFADCPSPVPTQVSLSPLSSKVKESTTKQGWKTFKGDYYEISFPSSWVFKGPVGSDVGFPQAIELISPNKTSGIQVGTKYSFPAGFENTDAIARNIITKTIDGVVFTGEETTLTSAGSNCHQIYTYFEANKKITFLSDKDQKQMSEPVLILYANDYPLYNVRASCKEGYQEDKTTIYQILSTFKFVEATPSASPQ